MVGLTFIKNTTLTFDETYVKVQMNQYYYTGNEATTNYTYSFVRGQYSHFPEISQSLLKQMNITNYICPETNDVYLMSNSFANNFTFFDVQIKRCSGTDSKGNPGKSDKEIDDALDSSYVQLAVVNNYFDFEDYSKPIKSYLNDELYYDLVSGFTKKIDINIRK